jgi:hypothetical protein
MTFTGQLFSCNSIIYFNKFSHIFEQWWTIVLFIRPQRNGNLPIAFAKFFEVILIILFILEKLRAAYFLFVVILSLLFYRMFAKKKAFKRIVQSWIFVIWSVIVYFCWRWAKFISCVSKLQATVSVKQPVASRANGRVRSDLWYSGSCRSRSRSHRRDRCSCFGGCSRAGLGTTGPSNSSHIEQPSSRVGHFPPLCALKCQHMLSRPPTQSNSQTGDQMEGRRKGGKKWTLIYPLLFL